MSLPAAEPGVFRGLFPLHYPDADATGHLRLTSLLDLLQNQAGEHTASLGIDHKQLKDQGVYWVISRMTLRFESWPTWPGVLTVDTWARGTKAVLALRDYRFGTDEWSGRGTAAWVLLKDRRPQRPEAWVGLYQQVRPEEPVVEVPASLPPLDSHAGAQSRAEPLLRHTHATHSDWEDIDLNGHVNNVSAIGWCLSLHSFAFLSVWRPEFLEANFLSEMFCDEKFQLTREELPAPEGRKTFDYLVIRAADQTPTLRLRITYKASQ